MLPPRAARAEQAVCIELYVIDDDYDIYRRRSLALSWMLAGKRFIANDIERSIIGMAAAHSEAKSYIARHTSAARRRHSAYFIDDDASAESLMEAILHTARVIFLPRDLPEKFAHDAPAYYKIAAASTFRCHLFCYLPSTHALLSSTSHDERCREALHHEHAAIR